MAETDQATQPEAQPGSTQPGEQVPPAPQLTVQDMITLKSAIELGTQRGAWRANELTAVGSVYERLSAFITSIMPAKEENTDQGEKSDD